MHETSLVKDLLSRIDATAATQGAQRVLSVQVWLGALSNMSAGHLLEHFKHASVGTAAEGARLDITVSDDLGHPSAMDVVLQGIDVET